MMKLPALPPKLASLFKRKTAAERLAEKKPRRPLRSRPHPSGR
jgi:hypothetical protein